MKNHHRLKLLTGISTFVFMLALAQSAQAATETYTDLSDINPGTNVPTGAGDNIVDNLTTSSTLGNSFNIIANGTNNVDIVGTGSAGPNLTLVGVNTYTGTTTVENAGTLFLDGGSSDIADSSAVIVNNNGDLYTETNQTIHNLQGNSTGIVTIDTSALTVNETSATTFSGVVQDGLGGGSLTVTGTGTLTLAGLGSYTGSTTVDSGATLSVANETSIASTSGIALNAGTLQVGATTGTTHEITQGVTLTGGGTINETTGDSGTVSGIISGAGGLTVNNGQTGTLTLAGNNTFSGSLTVDGGTLVLGGSNTYAGTTTVTNATLSIGAANSINSSSSVALSSSTFQFTGGVALTNATAFSLTGSNTIATGANGDTISGNITGTGSLIVTGSGSGDLQLLGTNNYSGGTTVASGTLNIDGSANIGAGNVTLDTGSTLEVEGGTVTNNVILSGSGIIGSVSGATFNTGVISGANSTLTINNGTGFVGTVTLAGNNTFGSTSGGLTVDAGKLILSGTNTYTGATTIASGATLSIVNETTIADSSGIALNAGTLQLGATSGTTHEITQGIVLTGGGTINPSNGDIATVSGIISGAGGLTVNSSTTGELILSGNNTFTGGLAIDAGAVSFTTGGSSGTNLGANAVTLADGGELLANGTGQTISNNITLSNTGGGTIGVANGNTDTFSGIISSTGGLTINSGTTGTVILTGANTNSGSISVNGGTLSFTTGGASGTNLSTNTVTLQGATLLENGTGQTVTNAIDLGTGGGTMSVANGDSDIFSGTISGSTALTINSGTTGTLIYNGTTGSLTGGVTVAGGTFEVGDATHASADLTGNVTVNAAGILAGHGTVTGNVTNSGTVAPGGTIGTMTVTGTYVQNSGGILSIELSPSQTSKLAVSSTASLAGTLNITPDAGTYVRGTTYTILTASAVSGTFTTVNDTAPALSTFGVEYNPTNVELIANGGGTTSYAANATTPNEKNVGAALDALSPSVSSGDMNTVLNALTSVPAADQGAALNMLTGEINANLQTGSRASMDEFNGLLGKRLGGDCNTPDLDQANPASPVSAQRLKAGGTGSAANSYIWGCGYGNFDTISGSGDLDSTLAGGALGVEYRPTAPTLVRFGFGYGHDSMSQDSTASSASLNSFQAGAYGQYNLAQVANGNLYVGGTLSGGYDYGTTNRSIVFGGLNRMATANPDGYDGSAGLLLGFVTKLAGVSVEPVLSTEYIYNNQNSYTESGAGAADLSVDSKATSTLRNSVGAQVSTSYGLDGNWMTLAPQLHAAFIYDAMDVTPSVNESFAGTSANFTATGQNPGRAGVQGGGGVALTVGQDVSVFADYNGTFKDHETDNAVMGGVKLSW